MYSKFTNTIKTLLTSCCLCLCIASQAQMFTNIRATQTMTVKAMVQTDNGNVWFGAGKTLYCFDGERIYAIDSEELNISGAISCMTTDREDNIVIGCERGLVTYNYHNETFTMEMSDNNVTALAYDGENEWIGTNRGLYHNGKEVIRDINVIAMIRKKDKMLVSTMEKCVAYNINSGKQQQVTLPHFDFITCFAETDKGNVAAGSVKSVLKYSGKANSMTINHTDMPVVKCMMTDNRGILMVGCDGGLYEIGTKEANHIMHDARNSRSLAGNAVWCMMKDKKGNLWLGTDNGLSIMSSTQDFCIYPLSMITESGKGNQVYCMLRDSHDRVWMGGSNGIVKVVKFREDNQSFAWYEMGSPLNAIPHNRIRQFYEDPIWGIWACTDGGLLHYDENEERWNLHPIIEDEHNWVYSISRESEALIVTTYNAVFRMKYDAENDCLTEVTKLKAKPCLDSQYKSINIGDTEWAITANGLRISDEGDGTVDEIELPEKFVSIYYNADNDLIYLGGSDIFAIIRPKSFGRQESTSIWFDADARFAGEEEDSGIKRGLTIGIIVAVAACLIILLLYLLQQRKIKIERMRRKAMLKSARDKMARLANDRDNLQHQLHIQQISAHVQQSNDTAEESPLSENMNQDDAFLMQVTRIIEEEIDNPELSVTMLSSKFNISSKQLYRKVKQCSGMTAVEYIRKLRLQKAAILLKNPEFTINEVMYMVGFSNPSYFSRSFASEYGMPPSEYRQAQN